MATASLCVLALACVLCALCTLQTAVRTAKVLAIPHNSRSHYYAMKRISEELAERGHEVILIAHEKQAPDPHASNNLRILTYAGMEAIGFHEDLAHDLIVNKAGILEMSTKVSQMQNDLCECILNDTNLIRDIKTSDVMITDSVLMCGSVLRDLLGIPRVLFNCGLVPPMLHAWLYGIPVPLSYVPAIFTGFTNQMTFLQRVVNVVHFSLTSLTIYYIFFRDGDAIKRRYNIRPERDVWETESDSELVLMQTDFAINYARPLPPGAIAIGPISPRPAQHLPRDLEEFMSMRNSEGEEGVVLVSFGSEADAEMMGEEFVNKMLTTFGRLKQKVLWKLKGFPSKPVPSNIKIMTWFPQNDLLGHANTRLFVTHAGHNGMFESAYHGIPMVGAPLAWDQLDNVRMMETAGLGIGVDIRAVTADQLYSVIQRVFKEPSFRANSLRVSSLLKDRRRTPVEEAADHIEWLLRHGSARHLRPAGMDMPWYQYFLIDVIAFLVTMATVTIVAMVYFVKCFCSVCRCDGRKRSKEKRS